MIRAEYARIIPVTLHFKGILRGNSSLKGGLLCLCIPPPPPPLVIYATKCQKFAFPTRARRWRGWKRGSRTPRDRRSAETFSADRTRRRYGVMRRLRYGRMCRVLRRRITSTPSPTDRSLRAITTGKRTATHRSFTSDRLTGDCGPGEMTVTTGGMPGRGVNGRRLNQTAAVRGKGARELQDPAPASLRVKGRMPTKMMMMKTTVQEVRRYKPRRRVPAGLEKGAEVQ